MKGKFCWDRLLLYGALALVNYGTWAAVLWLVNVHPLFKAGQDEAAYINIVLLLFSPAIFLEAEHYKFYGKLARSFVMAAMFVCYTQSVSGIAGKKDVVTDDNQTKITQYQDWQTKTEETNAQKQQVQKPEKYVYTDEVVYRDKKEALDRAGEKTKRECDSLYIRRAQNSDNAQKVCDGDRSTEKTLSEAFETVSVNYGYTKAMSEFALAIEHAKTEQAKLGVKPTYADSAYGRISKLTWGIISEQQLRDYMPMLLALLADAGFAFVPSMMMRGVDRRFRTAWGDRWWLVKSNTLPVVAHPPYVEKTPTLVENTDTLIEGVADFCAKDSHPSEEKESHPEPTPQPMKQLPAPKAKLKRKDYVPGVLAWKKGVIFSEKGDRLTASDLWHLYTTFCLEKGFPAAKLGVFSSILQDEGGETPKTIRGTGYFTVRMRPTIGLVKGGTLSV